MNAISRFNFQGATVRTVEIGGEPWFVLSDLCRVLGIANVGNVLNRLDEDMKSSIRLTDGTPGNPNRAIVSEPGMYDVIVRSDSPVATPFRRWITTEVLPQIRRTGSYSAAPELTGPVLVATALIEANKMLEAANATIAELAPPAQAWEAHMSADGDYSLRDAAQILARDHGIDTGQNRLSMWLREHGWIDPRGIPYQSRIDQGHLASRARTYEHPRTGERVTADPQVRVTPRGLDLIRRRMTGQGVLAVVS